MKKMISTLIIIAGIVVVAILPIKIVLDLADPGVSFSDNLTGEPVSGVLTKNDPKDPSASFEYEISEQGVQEAAEIIRKEKFISPGKRFTQDDVIYSLLFYDAEGKEVFRANINRLYCIHIGNCIALGNDKFTLFMKKLEVSALQKGK